MISNLTTAIIAGGKSKRFGSSKDLAPYRQQNLLQRASEIASSISDDIIIIGNKELHPEYTKFPVFSDVTRGCGPLCGLQSALMHAEKKYVAILPVDMPLLNAEIYRFMFPSCKTGKPVVAVSHLGIEPLVSIWPASAQYPVEKALQNGDYRLHRLLKNLSAIEIDLQEKIAHYNPDWFININYKKDLELLNLEKTEI